MITKMTCAILLCRRHGIFGRHETMFLESTRKYFSKSTRKCFSKARDFRYIRPLILTMKFATHRQLTTASIFYDSVSARAPSLMLFGLIWLQYIQYNSSLYWILMFQIPLLRSLLRLFVNKMIINSYAAYDPHRTAFSPLLYSFCVVINSAPHCVRIPIII